MQDEPNGKPAAESIALADEAVAIATRTVETARVQVHLTTETHTVVAETDLRSDEVTVTRVPVGRIVAEVPAVRELDGVTIIPVIEEVLVRQLMLREEIHLRRVVHVARASTPVQVRRQIATVRRVPAPPAILSNNTEE